MKKNFVLFILALTMLMPTLAFGDEAKPSGVYVGGHIGMSIENHSGRKLSEDDGGDWFGMSYGSKNDIVMGGGLSVGYDFDPQLGAPIRLELDYTARGKATSSNTKSVEDSGDVYDLKKKDKIGLQTLMLNAWFDIPTGTSLTPYVGGGIGFGFVDYKTNYDSTSATNPGDNEFTSGSKNKTNFAWSLGGGVAYDLTQNWTVDLGYRYIDSGKVTKKFKDEDGDVWAKSKVKVQSHDVMLGLRYTF